MTPGHKLLQSILNALMNPSGESGFPSPQMILLPSSRHNSINACMHKINSQGLMHGFISEGSLFPLPIRHPQGIVKSTQHLHYTCT